MGAVVVTFTVGMMASTFDAIAYGPTPSGAQLARTVLWWVLLAGVATAVVWRDRYAVVVCLSTAAAGVLTPVGAVAPLLALPFVIARERRWRVVVGCAAATALAVGVSFWRDEAREGEAVIFSITSTGLSGTSYLTPAGYAILTALLVAASVGAGFLRRAVGRADAAQQVAAAENQRARVLSSQADELRTEVSRQEERELIAREMHDTVAHELSLMSLQASAYEVSTDNPDVVDVARTLRSSAHRTLDEMRTLIASLRAGSEQYTGSAPALGDLATLLDDARAGGVDLTATVFVADADEAPAALTRAVYRVVQEALTNVMKHAPGARADVDVRARPGDGVDITVRNAVLPELNPYADAPVLGDPGATVGASGIPGGGSGLVEMRERCEAMGGTFDAGVQDGRYVVRAHLPWVHPTA
ncbi:sensor histidine kinase [Cellulosimicrobium sp. CUA-896]|uniref:sensor histidine kinase n=1 Tax=Cellulosimicrobium sp. CUA-896 TaxID=1517881 RepID=UPI0009625EB4|nr:histidine kinase [Cellulosimicrobium sp. CUA-896]OLT54628.1 hypothetical protein BJF88_07915 [Cellulosimicrobium sp. CUA-896]